VWAVGTAGAILRWDGQRWTDTTAAEDAYLTDVSAAAPDDVWAVGVSGECCGGSGVAMDWDGRGWTRHASANLLNAIHAVGDEARVAGDGGTFGRWRGGEWEPVRPGSTAI
jgi:photosystem II stability/assembly factor-like uncharacterized protein